MDYYKLNEELEKIIIKNLSEKRAEHIFSVAKEAEILRGIYLPGMDPEKIKAAALLHAITTEYTFEEHLETFARYGVEVPESYLNAPSVLHSHTAALVAEKEYGADEEVCRAISCHTTGRANMSVFEKILFLADIIEEKRTNKMCVTIRTLFFRHIRKAKTPEDRVTHLDKTVFVALNSMLSDLINESKYVHMDTIEARNSLLLRLKDRKERPF